MLKKKSQLLVPNDPAYLEGILSYTKKISMLAGFSHKEVKEIKMALREACLYVIHHAFEPHEEESFTITFNLTKDGIMIMIDEMGLPFSPRFVEDMKHSPGLHLMEENLDKILFINRGKEGKELQLFKYLKGKHVEDIFSEEELTPYDYCELPARKTEYTIRLMRPEEALYVSRCIYRAYKYTYLNENLYFPERIEEMNREKSMISAVVLTGEGEMVAHFALLPRENGKVAEIGAAVVVPRHQKRGLMKQLLAYLIEEAKKRDFLALVGNAYSMHPFSQKTNLKFDFSETALQLGAFPPGSIKFLTDRGLHGAGHTISFFKYLKKGKSFDVYLPPKHETMLKRIYAGLGLVRKFRNPSSQTLSPSRKESELHLLLKASHKVAFISIVHCGRDLKKRIKKKQVELSNKQFNVVCADLDLRDPLNRWSVSKLESLGFIFSGLLPDYAEGDILRLQYYTTDVDYDEIETVSPLSAELVNYVKKRDPKWRVLH